MRMFLSFVAALVIGGAANAQSSSFTYTGRLLLTDGVTAATGTYSFYADVKAGSCVVFRRSFTATVDTDGKFQLVLSDLPMGGSDFGTSIQDALQTTGPSAVNCLGGATGLRSDARSLEVFIQDGMSWENIDTQNVTPSYEAVNAQKLQGLTPSGTVGNVVVANAANKIPLALIPQLTTNELPSFSTILGSSTIGIDRGGTGATTRPGAINALLPSQTGYVNAYLQTDGTNVTWGTVAAGGAATTVSAGNGLEGGTFSTVGTISLGTSGVSPGTYGSLSNQHASFTVDQYGRITSASTVAISLNANQITAGTIALALLPEIGPASTYTSGIAIPTLAVDVYGRLTVTGSTAISLPVSGITGLSGDVVTGGTTGVVAATIGVGVVDSSKIANGSIMDIDIAGTAGISDSKLATISSAGKVDNSATTATAANTNNTIVARDANGSFSASSVSLGTLSGHFINASTGSISAGFVQAGTLSGQLNISNLSGLPSCASGEVVYSNGTTFSCVPAATGSLVGVVGSTGITTGTTANVVSVSLATTNVSAGSFGSASWGPNFIVDAYGRLTGAGSTQIAIAATQITSGTVNTAQLGTTGIVAGVYGDSTHVPQFTVDAQGRIVSVTSQTIVGLGTAGIQSLNGLTIPIQGMTFGTAGLSPAISSAGTLHTFDIPMSDRTGVTAGLISNSNFNTLMYGTLAASRIEDLDAAKITSGTFNLLRIGTIPSSQVSGNIPFTQLNGTISMAQAGTIQSSQVSGNFPFSQLNGTISVAQLGAIDGAAITNIAGSSITSGTLDLARIGTIGASQVSGNFAFTQLTGTISMAQVGTIQATQLAGNLPFTQVSGTISNSQLGSTTVTAGTFGSSTHVPTFTVDAQGRLQAASSVAISFPASSGVQSVNGLSTPNQIFEVGTSGNYPYISSNGTTHTFNLPYVSSVVTGAGILGSTEYQSMMFGTIGLSRGGTGLDTSSARVGQLLMGTGSGLTLGTLAVGGNMTMSYLNGTLTIDSVAGGTGSVTSVAAGAGLSGGTFSTAGTISLGTIGAAGSYGGASWIPNFTTDIYGRVTSVGSTSISLNGSQIGSGTLNLAQIGTIGFSQVSGSLGFGSLYGTIGLTQLGTFDASSIGTGTLALARIGTVPMSQVSGSLGFGSISGTIGLAQLGTFDASSIGTGTLALARIGTVPMSQLSGSLAFTALYGTMSTAQLGTTNVAAGSYGSNSYFPTFSVDSFGRLTTVGSQSVSLNALSGTIGVANGGTGLNGSSAANGALLVGNGSGFSLSNLSAMNGIVVTNQVGTIALATNGTFANVGNSLVQRSPSGGFTAGTVNVQSLALLGTGSVTLSAPTGTYTMNLPANMGTPGQFLTTNGTSSLSWNSLGSALGIPGSGHPILFADNGTVGSSIGFTYDPTGYEMYLNGFFSIANLDGSGVELTRSGAANLNESIFKIKSGSVDTTAVEYIGGYASESQTATAHGGYLKFSSVPNGGTLSIERMRIDNTGYVGIGTYGTVNSGVRLEARGGAIRAGFRGSSAGEGGLIQLSEISGNGTNTVAFRAPDSITNNVTWVLPNTDGTFGQALVTNGTGALSWTTAPGLTFPMVSTTKGSQSSAAYTFSTDSDTGIYSPGVGTLAFATDGTTRLSVSTMGVGIGTLGPLSLFHVNGSANVQVGTTYGSRFTQSAGYYSNNPVGVNATALFSNNLSFGAVGGGFGTISAIVAQTTDSRSGGGNFGAFVGINGIATGSGNQNSNEFVGVRGLAETLSGSGIAAEMSGVQGRVIHGGGNDIPKAYGLYAAVEDLPSGSGTIGRAFGVYVGSLGVSGTRYSIYTEDTQADSYFSGSIGVGILQPLERLDVAGGIRILGTTGNSGVFRLGVAAGTTSVGFRAPNNVTSNILWALPSTDGTSGHSLATNGAGSLYWAPPSSLVGGMQYIDDSVSWVSPNNTRNAAAISPTGTLSADADLVLSARGDGALLARMPDNLASGGNKRGLRSVDFQRFRTANDQVASGLASVIGGGENNRASGAYALIGGGFSNQATQSYSIVTGGASNQATADSASVTGGSNNVAAGHTSYIAGGSGNSVASTAGTSAILGGFQNVASAPFTVVGGMANTAATYGQTSLGMFSNSIAGNDSSYVATDPLLIVGNGTASGFRSNAMVILKNGYVGIGNIVPTAPLEVQGEIKVGTSGADVIGSIRYTGGDFEGRRPTGWASLTSTGTTSGFAGVVNITTATQAVTTGNYGTHFTYNFAGAGTITLPSLASVANGFNVTITRQVPQALTINANGADTIQNTKTSIEMRGQNLGTITLMKLGSKWAITSTVDDCVVGEPCWYANHIYMGTLNGYQYFTTPGNCSNSASPTCDGSIDTLTHNPWATDVSTLFYPSASYVDGRNLSSTISTGSAGAARYCESMTYATMTDWYLPAPAELKLLYDNRGTISGLNVVVGTPGTYWSSTETTATNVTTFNFLTGAVGTSTKNTGNLTRCVRRM